MTTMTMAMIMNTMMKNITIVIAGEQSCRSFAGIRSFGFGKSLGRTLTTGSSNNRSAAFILEKDPANYEFVRRVLGHKNLQTTINYYVGLETIDAVRKFSAMALEYVDWSPMR